MSNFFADDVASPAVDKGNFFSDTTNAPDTHPSEIEVIQKTNSPTKETPMSFGLVDVNDLDDSWLGQGYKLQTEIGKSIAGKIGEAARGVANVPASLPRIVGAETLKTGELLSTQEKGASAYEVAKNSFMTRFYDFALENKAAPDIFSAAGMAFLSGKDAIASMVFPDGQVPKVIVNSANNMIKDNTAARDFLGISRKGDDGVAYDLGNVFGQIGISVIAKKPTLAAGYMGLLVDSEDYLEARAAGKTAEESAGIAASSAYGQAAIEFIGQRYLTTAYALSKPLKAFLVRTAVNGAEEFGQSGVEEAIKGYTEVRDLTPEQVLHTMAYSAMLGFIGGGSVAAIQARLEAKAKEVGIPQDVAEPIIDGLIKNKDNLVDAATQVIDKESAGVVNNQPAQAEARMAAKQVLDETVAIEEAVAGGNITDPQMAAKVMLREPTIPIEAKQNIRALGQDFTMEDLQKAVAKTPDVMLAESLALEDAQAADLQSKMDKWKTMSSSIRETTSMTKKQIKQAQQRLIDFISESDLRAEDRAKFIPAIRDTQTAKQLVNNIDGIEARILSIVDANKRRSLISKLKKTLATVKDSDSISVDFAKRVEALIGDIDLTKRNEKSIKTMQATLDYMRRNPDADMPNRVLDKLELLNKKPIEDVTTQELESLYEDVSKAVERGKLKFKLLENQKARLKEKRIEDLQKDSVPLSDVELKRAPIGERLSAMDRIKNKYTDTMNRAARLGLATNPMDVFFDMLDGGKSYKGANYKIFKQTVDKSFSKYLDLKESVTREVKSLTDQLNLSEQSFDKIGAWAVLQQEGGEKKLLDTGYTKKEIDALALNESEIKMYQLMREKLDSMLPAIQKTMREVYNQDVAAVSDYFPFMTDHDAMVGTEIQDQLGPNVASIAKKKNVEKGFTVTRTLGSQKIRIDALGVFLRHVDNAAYLVEMGGDIKSLGDVAQSKEYADAVGDVGQEMVTEWINLLARKGNIPGRIAAIDTLRRNVGFAMLGFKLSTVLIQPTALADGAALVGGGYVARGVKDVATSSEWRKFLWKNFPEVRERTGDDPAYLDLGGKGIVGDVRQAGFWALQKIDSLIASSVAAGAYSKSVEARGGVVDLSNPDKTAIEDAQRLMRRTQSSAFAKDVPALLSQGKLTGNVSLDKLIFQFQSFMLNRWSLIKHDMWELGIKDGNTKQALSAATFLLLASAAEIGIRRLSKEIIAGILDNDMEPWEDSITEEAIATALGSVPFVSQGVSALQYGSIPVPSIGVLTQAGERLKWAAQSKSEGKKAQHYTEAGILIGGAAFGIPGTLQVEQLFRGALKDSGKKSKASTP